MRGRYPNALILGFKLNLNNDGVLDIRLPNVNDELVRWSAVNCEKGEIFLGHPNGAQLTAQLVATGGRHAWAGKWNDSTGTPSS